MTDAAIILSVFFLSFGTGLLGYAIGRSEGLKRANEQWINDAIFYAKLEKRRDLQGRFKK